MTGILSVQFNPKKGNKKTNIEYVRKEIDKFSDKKLDLVVFPEFFSTGIDHHAFTFSAEDINGGETIKQISEIAKQYHTNIVAGTVIEKENEKLYNTSFVINRNGDIVDKYRKIHLYNYMGGTEGNLISAGNEIKTVNLDFGKIGLSICFDMRYPQQFKELVKLGAEIIVVPTAWTIPNEVYNDKHSLDFAKETWIAMNKMRAFDNLVYFVSCGQVGPCSDNLSCLGNSMILSPTSEVLVNANYEEISIYANIDLEVVKVYKSVYPIAEIE